ncbi:hypothetical protein ANANG_G00133920 [Anguilla anguilla]|uniref:Teneurin N-terminal domain-containing protein n=1 Tax=Anguilla anguilla TaxID=7936 RepID=A0A9D3M9L2_ANGAN|nr:hypothetical protein ANANG_G00133920 [Anguilla anguilla]
MVHREAEEFARPGQNFTLRQLGICEPATRRGVAFCADMGLSHRGYPAGPGARGTRGTGARCRRTAPRASGAGGEVGAQLLPVQPLQLGPHADRHGAREQVRQRGR